MKEKFSACSKAAAEPLNRYGPRTPHLHHQVVIMGPYGWSPSPWWRPLRALEEFSAMGVFSLESLLTLKFLDPITLLIFSNLPASLLKWDGNWWLLKQFIAKHIQIMLKSTFGCVKQSLQLGQISPNMVQNKIFFFEEIGFWSHKLCYEGFANESLFFQKIMKWGKSGP